MAFELTITEDFLGNTINPTWAGYTLEFGLKRRAKQPINKAPVQRSTTDGNIAVTGAVAKWTLTEEETAALPRDHFLVAEVRATNTEGRSAVISLGRCVYDESFVQAA